jgi:hypothetical protein
VCEEELSIARRDNLRRIEEKSMQNTNAEVGVDERNEIPSEEEQLNSWNKFWLGAKSDAYDWAFQTRMPVPAMESRSTSSQVEVALNR